ncbi:MAG: tetratricopeptide repeat protein [Cyanobacteria bacterium SZAS LIN-3]|nr:tetratricopeptide repeat protein [Cyanobacteria bacterium SZAS LIN-3]
MTKKHFVWIGSTALVVTLVGTSALIFTIRNVFADANNQDENVYNSLPMRKMLVQSTGLSGADGNISEKSIYRWEENQNILDKANSLQAEGVTAAANKNNKGALELYEASLEAFKQYPGLGCPQVVVLLTDKARLEGELGLTAEREKTLRLLVEAAEKSYNPRHAQVAIALEALGDLLCDRDRESEALPLLQRAYDIRLKGAGLESGDTAYTISLLGHCYLDLKDYSKADDCYKQAIEIYHKLDGEGFSESQQIARDNLANSYRWQNRYKDAMDSDMALLAELKAKKLDSSYFAAGAYCSAASTAQSQKDKAKMHEFLNEAKKIADTMTQASDLRKSADIYNDIGDVYDDEDDLAGELMARQKSLNCLKELKYSQKEDKEQIAVNLVKAGYCSFKLKDLPRASEYYGEALAQAKSDEDIRVKLKDNKKQIEEYLQYIQQNKRTHQDATMQMQANELKELIVS